MTRPTFMCSHADGRWPNHHPCRSEADVLVVARAERVMHGACLDHVAPTIALLLGADDRASISVRNARTWHTPRTDR